MGIFLNLFGSKEKKPVDETHAQELHKEILVLETKLENEPLNTAIQQELITKYSQASSVFSQAPSFRFKVDGVFKRINELRNMARSNF